jgi:hypothetical protein
MVTPNSRLHCSYLRRRFSGRPDQNEGCRSDHEVLDFGRVSDTLIKALKLMLGEFIRADQMCDLAPDAVV